MMDFGPILVLVIILVVIVIIGISRRSRTKKPSRRRMVGSHGVQDFQSQWRRIEGIMAQPGIESSRSALFEADKLMDSALRQRGFRGETMGERLKNAREHFQNNAIYQGIWEAHKMRNAMAHELGFDLPKAIAHQHLDKFKAGLQYLKVL